VSSRIVILGGGVAGLSVAWALRYVHAATVQVVEREQPGVLPSNLYALIAGKRRRPIPIPCNATVIRGEAVFLDARRRHLILADHAIPYDVLVVATGSRPCYERDEWARRAPSLKSTEDAGHIHKKLRDRDTSAVIVGGGVAGVELASTVARADRDRRVVLVEDGPRLLAGFPEELASDVQRQLQTLGIEIRFGLHTIGIDGECVRFSGAGGRQRITSRAVLWAGGVEGSGFGAVLRSETGAALDEVGRVCVTPELTVPGHPEIFVIGDLARSMYEGRPLDGLATVAS
jgi:NADH:ubiquinone reductase (H+-translocating)